ncbi:DNA alkylation repair protein [Jeotgalibacillus sp. JSM ZJ347]|uniref:DNA alkylation repair protein n=1 Tax=Jeotgalibacillus sp. JSM ZJ347 TaxID=3342117 RepID=UPI0035A848AA
MAAQLKDIYTKDFLLNFSRKVQSVYPAFYQADFINSIMDETWDELALKARTRRISEKLGEFLPDKYEDALDVLFNIADDCVGFPYLFFPDFVAVYGQAEEHWDLSMTALENFTQKSSAEFAIRPFLLRDPDKVMNQMTTWAKHPNEHVRRLASEGCRPRLPWGESLPMFKKDPTPVLSVLEILKEDALLYVRKSVANNLNDISKDHPDLVLETARQWTGKNPDTDWIIRHGCRTLIKHVNPEAMALFGYAMETTLTNHASISAQPDALTIGEKCELHYQLTIRPGEPVYLRVEYAIDFIKTKGQTSRKSFLLSNKTVSGGAHLTGTRTHNWSDLTTRRHYPGEHRIVLLVNGQEVADTVLDIRQQTDE